MRVATGIFAICLGTIASILVLAAYLSHKADVRIREKMEAAFSEEFPEDYWKINNGNISSLDGKSVFTQQDFQQAVKAKDKSIKGHTYFWQTEYGASVASKLGSDSQHHFVQGYLSNFQPFYTDKMWIPLITIAQRKTYMYDNIQYNGLIEVWQYSREAYLNTRGDCEDHSMILCDWLNSLGYDSRVVCGMHGTSGHAWVVLYLDGEAFILEATQKSNLSSNTHYPLASILPMYKPEFMFDKDYYYEPKQRLEFRSHDKQQWKKTSVYTRNS